MTHQRGRVVERTDKHNARQGGLPKTRAACISNHHDHDVCDPGYFGDVLVLDGRFLSYNPLLFLVSRTSHLPGFL